MIFQLNPDMPTIHRKFFNEVKRCDDLENKLAFIERETKKLDIKIAEVEIPKAPQPHEIIDLEAIIDKFESELKEVNANVDTLHRNFTELTELKEILLKTESYFGECEQRAFDDLQEVVTQDAAQTPIKFDFVAGVIHTERVPAFECMIWRVCQGLVFLRVVPIEEEIWDIKTETEVRKSVFIIFSQGDNHRSKVKKICEGFRASVYPIPDTPKERTEMLNGVQTRLSDLSLVLGQSRDHRVRLLNEFTKLHNSHFIQIRKAKAIYHMLNCFNWDVTQKCLIGECWVPNYATVDFAGALKKSHAESNSTVPPIWNPLETHIKAPTHYQTNKFSGSFQVIVDSYGVGNYREVNPAPYACITFPFLFAVMFGDAGHGFIMLLFAIYLCLYEKSLGAKKKGEIFDTIFSGRYIILLMGCFSTYTGLIYNDVFSKSINIFGSQWGCNYTSSELLGNDLLQLSPTTDEFYGEPYYFGIDPIWQLATNKLNYLDSYKMKLSVILGVVQMLFGVFLGIFNHLYFRRYENIILEWIPELIFLLVMFGYLDMLIFWKWFKYTPEMSQEAPNLLINLINMFLGKDDDLTMYNNERTVETVLVIIAIVCVPWMLLIKPFIVRWRFNNAKKKGLEHIEFHELTDADGNFMMGEEFVHQIIHTIEYCLGCISNTASYLRLWALSLAHNQLSDVLWTLVMRIGFAVLPDNAYGGGAVMYIIFAFWAVLTLSILLVMEGLSAFLHALRLHWVEFMNKFYVGDGYLYAPFSFKQILSDEEQI